MIKKIIKFLSNYGLLQKYPGGKYRMDKKDNKYFSNKYDFCKECDYPVLMCSSDMKVGLADYKWRCSNKNCNNNKCPENTFDSDKPEWVYYWEYWKQEYKCDVKI